MALSHIKNLILFSAGIREAACFVDFSRHDKFFGINYFSNFASSGLTTVLPAESGVVAVVSALAGAWLLHGWYSKDRHQAPSGLRQGEESAASPQCGNPVDDPVDEI